MNADPVRSVELYQKAIDVGVDINGMVNLHSIGTEGVEVNFLKAMELYEHTVMKGGHVNAMFGLAVLLENGNGAAKVEANLMRAVELHERASQEEGLIGASFNLASLLENGREGLSPNPARAVERYIHAVEKSGHVEAMVRLGSILSLPGMTKITRSSILASAGKLYCHDVKNRRHVRSESDLCNGNQAALKELGIVVSLYCEEHAKSSLEKAKELYTRAIEEDSHVKAI